MLNRTRKGFTLLELIVVIVILGILAAIAIPTFKAVIDKSKFASLKETAQSLGNNTVALAAFDQVAPLSFAPATGATAAQTAGALAFTTSKGEVSSSDFSVTASTNSSKFSVARTDNATIVACVTLPSGVNGAATVAQVASAAACV